MSHELKHNLLYSCEETSKRASEQLVPEHTLGYIVSGQSRFSSNSGISVYGEGTIGLIKRNQLAKTVKIPSEDNQPFKSISILLDQERLRKYCTEHQLTPAGPYTGEPMITLTGDPFLQSFFSSLIPYFEQPAALSAELAELKTREAIALLLRVQPALQHFLFDFSEPGKIDLEAFMNTSYQYNIPLREFARLSGRSLSTFKRDFGRIYTIPPEKWLLAQRLERAHYLICEQGLSPGNACIDAGFENLSHFSGSFRKRFGYSPSSLLRSGRQASGITIK